jgi:hypothetical protein
LAAACVRHNFEIDEFAAPSLGIREGQADHGLFVANKILFDFAGLHGPQTGHVVRRRLNPIGMRRDLRLNECSFSPVNRYCESFVKAKSQTHFWLLSLHSICKLKSTVRQIFAVPSADEVASRLQMKTKGCLPGSRRVKDNRLRRVRAEEALESVAGVRLVHVAQCQDTRVQIAKAAERPNPAGAFVVDGREQRAILIDGYAPDGRVGFRLGKLF